MISLKVSKAKGVFILGKRELLTLEYLFWSSLSQWNCCTLLPIAFFMCIERWTVVLAMLIVILIIVILIIVILIIVILIIVISIIVILIIVILIIVILIIAVIRRR